MITVAMMITQQNIPEVKISEELIPNFLEHGILSAIDESSTVCRAARTGRLGHWAFHGAQGAYDLPDKVHDLG